MAALNPDRTLDFCSANDQSNVEIRFVDEDDFPLINIMEHRASEEEFYSDESQSSEQESSEDSADESTQEVMEVVEREWSREIKQRRDIDFKENPGINVNTRDLKSCLDFFSLFFTPEVWQLLVSQTNLYAEQKRGPRESSVWYPVTVDEMKAWLSLYLDMGLVTKPSISSYLHNYAN
nr:piggyBac transposable element-derived protein 5-like [Pocillopora verrucosa]